MVQQSGMLVRDEVEQNEAGQHETRWNGADQTELRWNEVRWNEVVVQKLFVCWLLNVPATG